MNAFTLARHYITVLHEEVSPENIAEAVRRNASEPDPNIDHMADFTDTNEDLLTAWERMTGAELEFDPENTENLAVLNAALQLAKRSAYRITVALALHLHQNGHQIDKQGRLLDPAKRLLAAEIANTHGVEAGTARAAVHMVHVWCLGTVPVGTADKI